MERAGLADAAGVAGLGHGAFVGRESELTELDGALSRAINGHGGVRFVVGEAGSGKTALVREFARRAQDEHDDLMVALGQSDAQTGIGDPYLPFREVLALLTGDVDDDLARGKISEENASRLRRFLGISGEAIIDLGPDLVGTFIPGMGLAARAATFIARRSGHVEKLEALADGDRPHPQFDGRGIKQSHIFEQYTNVLTHMARHQPLLLVIDDLQWADVGSIGLLFKLGRSIGSSRVSMIGTYRPAEVALGRDGERHPLEKVVAELKRYSGEAPVNLGEIGSQARRHFVDALIDSEPHRLDVGFRHALFDHTAGHPLFTVELLRSLRERGDLTRDQDGCWTTGPSLHWDALPVRVEGVIEERIGRLNEDAHETLTVASVEGETFTAEVVASVQDIEALTLVRLLGRDLEQQHGLVRSQGLRYLQPAGRRLSLFAFRHNLFQRYLYQGLNDSERAYLHEDVGNAIEAFSKDCPDEYVVQLARHFSEAGVAVKAVDYLQRAGELAAQRFANEEAVDYLSRALALLPESDAERRWDVVSDRERLLGLLGMRDAQRADLDALGGLADVLGDDGLRAEVAVRRAESCNRCGDFAGAALAAEEGIRHALVVRDVAREARAQVEWGTALISMGSLAEAQQRLEHAFALAEGGALHRIQAGTLKGLARIRLERGEVDAASLDYQEALRICRRLGDEFGQAEFIGNLGIVRQKQGELRAAKQCFEEVYAAQKKMGDRRGEGISLHNLGEVESELHDYAAAQEAYRGSLQYSLANGEQAFAATTLCSLGGVAVRLGRYTEAGGLLNQSLAISQSIDQRADIGFALAWLALLHLSEQHLDQALAHSQQARSIAHEVSEPLLEGRALDFMGRSLAASGRLSEASDAYQRSMQLRAEFGLVNAAVEPHAGLAGVALAMGDLETAVGHVDAVLAHLLSGNLDSTDSPGGMFLTCYRVLDAAGDPRAPAVLVEGRAYLHSMMDRIEDPDMRRGFSVNVAAHRELLSLAEPPTP